jgi:hypothetical protein
MCNSLFGDPGFQPSLLISSASSAVKGSLWFIRIKIEKQRRTSVSRKAAKYAKKIID